MMIALKPLPVYILPAGDIIQRRADFNREEARKTAHRKTRRTPVASCPFLPWLLHQEALYWQAEKPQPAPRSAQPTYHVYHLRGELPHNAFGNLIWDAVSFIGSFYDALRAARA